MDEWRADQMEDRFTVYQGPLAFDLHTLTVFVVVCEMGGMTKAAQRLTMTQSAVSHVIRKLEIGLGTKLLDRRARPVKPTQAGEELLAHGHGLLEAAIRTQAAVRDIGHATLPRLRIGYTDSFASTAGPTFTKRLRNFADNITVWSGLSTSLINDLVRRDLDAVVSWQPLRRLEKLDHRPLMTEPFVIVVPPRMAAAVTGLSLDQLTRNHSLIRYSLRSQIGRQIERFIEDQEIDVSPGLQFDQTDAVYAMVAASMGWAITTPTCLVDGRVHLNEIVPLPMQNPGLERTLYLVFREGEFGHLPQDIETLAKETLTEKVVERVRELVPWVAGQITINS
jgi:DNA-binding transcriptional LysR family regulator